VLQRAGRTPIVIGLPSRLRLRIALPTRLVRHRRSSLFRDQDVLPSPPSEIQTTSMPSADRPRQMWLVVWLRRVLPDQARAAPSAVSKVFTRISTRALLDMGNRVRKRAERNRSGCRGEHCRPAGITSTPGSLHRIVASEKRRTPEGCDESSDVGSSGLPLIWFTSALLGHEASRRHKSLGRRRTAPCRNKRRFFSAVSELCENSNFLDAVCAKTPTSRSASHSCHKNCAGPIALLVHLDWK